MRVQAVDFASVAWATCIGDGSPQPDVALDAWRFPTEGLALRALTWWWNDDAERQGHVRPDVMVVEDLPQHLPRWDSTVRNVARMQGRLIERMESLGHKDDVLFVPPGTWQRHHEGVMRGGIAGALAAATRLGYAPPDLVERYREDYEELKGAERQKVRERLKKLMTDYTDAFLIYRWAIDTYAEKGTLDVPTTQRYLR